MVKYLLKSLPILVRIVLTIELSKELRNTPIHNLSIDSVLANFVLYSTTASDRTLPHQYKYNVGSIGEIIIWFWYGSCACDNRYFAVAGFRTMPVGGGRSILLLLLLLITKKRLGITSLGRHGWYVKEESRMTKQ
jgi:hypothetical protein